MLVHGALGAVGSVAAQLARRAGATVVPTVRSADDLTLVRGPAVALDADDPADAIRALAPNGVDRIVEVAFSENADLDAAVVRNGAVIAAYATRADRPEFPFWPMLFANLTIRLLGSDDFPPDAKRQAAADLTAAARDGELTFAVAEPLPLAAAARAHDLLEAGNRQRVLLAVAD